MAEKSGETWKALSPFQYGIDFGLIGGLQAMPGFLKVRYSLQMRVQFPKP
jgi:hypothetical protein